MDHAFSFRGAKLGKIKSLALSAPSLGEAFLGGEDALQYVAGGTAYTITASKRGSGDIKHFGGSPQGWVLCLWRSRMDGAHSVAVTSLRLCERRRVLPGHTCCAQHP